MKKFTMYKSIPTTLALVTCVALPVWAADPVTKQKGSKAHELQAAKAQAQPVKPITTSSIEGPPAVRPGSANAGADQPPAATGEAK
jgi:hypothetical protein